MNCAALPEQLLESELFGYERGAFTSAQQAKPGQIELAADGVLFLDEVTEMSLAAQAKFLRVLQEREFQRLGATRIQKADIRVIAATNRDLRKAVERGDFREDLYYRLKVFDIVIPPLRERSGDILPIGEALLLDIGKSFARPPAGLTRDAREALLRYHWPGNVRELRNALERAAILCEGGLIRPEHLALDAPARPAGHGLHRSRHDRARHHRPGAGRVPLEQNASCQASRPHAHAALSPAAEVRAREAARGVAQLKDDLGLDHFEGRTYAGWTHHVVLAAVAFTFLQIERARQPDAPRPTLPVVRGWVREVLGLLYILHNRRLLGMLDSFRRNAPLRR